MIVTLLRCLNDLRSWAKDLINQRPLLVGLAVAVIAFSAGTFVSKVVIPALVNPSESLSERGHDFAAYYTGAWETARGNSPYHAVHVATHIAYVLDEAAKAELQTAASEIPGYIYPPPLAFLFRPFVSLGFRAALTIWLAVNCGVVLLCGMLCVRLFGNLANPLFAWSVGALVFLASMPTFENVLLGQMNYTMLVLCLFAYVLAERQHSYGAGVLLALASWIKLTPGFLLLYFVWHRRDWKFLQAFAISAIVIGALSVWWIGIEQMRYYLLHVLPGGGPNQLNLDNKSFLGMIDRLFGPNPLMSPLFDGPELKALLKLALLFALLWFSTQARQNVLLRLGETQASERLIFAFTLLLMLLCQPLLRVHHLIFAFPMLIAVAAHIQFERRSLLAGFLLVIVMLLLNSRGWNAFEKFNEHWISVFLIAPQAWGLLLLATLGYFCIGRTSTIRIASQPGDG